MGAVMQTKPTLFVIDDDPTSRESIGRLAASMGTPVREFDSAEAFLQQYNEEPGCVVTDYRLSGLTGLELQEKLLERDWQIPVIIVTGYARTTLTVKAMQSGAVTLLDKPYNDDDLWKAIRDAFARDAQMREQRHQEQDVERRLASLTEKERLVLDRILTGKANKAMAAELQVSLRTIENRRRNVFAKLGAGSVAELVAMVLHHRPPAANGASMAPDQHDKAGSI